MNALHAPLTPSSSPPASASAAIGFADLDERLRGGAPGVLLVLVPSSEVAHAVAAHVARRARALGATALHARPRPGAPLFCDVALRLGVVGVDCSAQPCAAQIAASAAAQRAIIVAPLPWIGSWDRAVAAELSHLAGPHLVVFVAQEDLADCAKDIQAERYDVSGTLDAVERTRFWSAVAGDADALAATSDLAALHGWWETARRARREAAAEARVLTLSAGARDLLSALVGVGRPWPLGELPALPADPSALQELEASGLVEMEGTWVTVADGASDDDGRGVLPVGVCAKLASALSARFPGDAWARARAAGLLLGAEAYDQADEEHAAALVLADDSVVRQELVSAWRVEVDAVPNDAQLTLRMRAAERALAIGEADEAHRWAQTAAVLAPTNTGVTLLLGRASVALGDLVAAKVALERGRAANPAPATAALIAVELAEVACLNGDWAEATREASLALELSAGDPARCATTLRARNTLGKLLLARSSWAEADRHFAEDALLAMAHGERTAELRARLNRGIALMSCGSLDEARAIFEAVLDEGERAGDARACAFALDNLSVVATWRHEYANALALSERTLQLRQRLGDRLTMARILGNLAELRRKLGLFDHAEHAIAFGRRALGPGMPPERSAHFSFVAARLALARGRTAEAQREVTRALADGETAGHRMILAEAHRVATRIALEDGDTARAYASLDRATEQALTDEARAEVALLRALVARAEGDDALALATDALTLCRGAGEEELLREAHVLLAELHKTAGQIDLARSHVEQAIVLRDDVAGDLPSDIRTAFLARTDVVGLGRLQAILAGPSEDAGQEPEPTTRRNLPSSPTARRAAAREMVGDDPAVRGLLLAIRKVARANSTVLIRGESGTGKELVAEALHHASDRASGPLVTVNCAALVETLLLSELFGHEKGAFTGAVARRRGRFELAEGGTLFLDEIGDISPRTQVALLRVLQERTFERVGGTSPVRTNARIVCATHRDLRAMVERGEFREDLYYRLRGITLEVPPLRLRMGDLPRIAEHLLARIAVERNEEPKTLSSEALNLLRRHRWPGNIRELENALRAASLFAEGSVIDAGALLDNVEDLRNAPAAAPSGARTSDWPPQVSQPDLSSDVPPTTPRCMGDDDDAVEGELPVGESRATAVAYSQVRQGSVSLAEMKRQIERDCIARALAETRGNITRAAALLGMKRPRLSQLVKQYGLAVVSLEESS